MDWHSLSDPLLDQLLHMPYRGGGGQEIQDPGSVAVVWRRWCWR